MAPGSYRPLGDVIRPHVGWVGRRLLTRPGGKRWGLGSGQVPPSRLVTPPGAQKAPGPAPFPGLEEILHVGVLQHPTAAPSAGEPHGTHICRMTPSMPPCSITHPSGAGQAGASARQRHHPLLPTFMTDLTSVSPPIPFSLSLSYGVQEPPPAPWTKALKASNLETQPHAAPPLCPAYSWVTAAPLPSRHSYLGSW